MALCIEIKLTYFGEGRKGSAHVPGEEVCISYLILNPSKGGRLFSGLETTAGCPATHVPHCQLYIPPPFALPSHWPSGLVLKCTKHTFPLLRTLLLQVVMYVSPSHTSGVCTKKPSVIPVNRTRLPSPSSTYPNPFPDSFFFCKGLFPLGVSHIFICQIFFIVFVFY